MRFSLLLVKLSFCAVVHDLTYASVGGILSGIDRRFKAFVLMAGRRSSSCNMRQVQFLTADRARAYEKIVSEPKRFKLYEAPHALNAEARQDRIAFLTEILKLKTLPATAINSIPDLYQPPAVNWS